MAGRLLMLDSGAFSVWSKGITISVDDYADFCIAHPKTSYFVSLDVIPGSPTAQYRTAEVVESAASQGWKNYLRMLKKGVLFEKLIPVFHQGESFKWLEKMLDIEAPYIGLGGIQQVGRAAAIRWLKTVRNYLLNCDGSPKVRVHGFAVNDLEVMRVFPWHSVDAASWGVRASYGSVWAPKVRKNKNLFSDTPLVIGVTERSPTVGEFQSHYDSLSPLVRNQVDTWFSSCGVAVGEVGQDHSVCTLRNCAPARRIVNARMMQEVSEATGILIYLAGTSGDSGTCSTKSEYVVTRRLLAYSMLRGSGNGLAKLFESFCDRLD